MKKLFYGFAIFLVLAGCFVACKKSKSTLNDFGFYEDLDEAKEIAKKEKKDIILVVAMEGYDNESAEFKENVLVTEEFKSFFSENFVGVYFDFGDAAYSAAEVKPGATKEEQDEAMRKAELMAKNMQFARLLNVQYTPVVYILTADGYYAADLQYSENFKSMQSFAAEVAECAEDLAEVKFRVEATKKGSIIERMNAINDIYKSTKPSYLPTFASLFRQATEIDKKNESGLVSRLYMESVLTDSMIYYSVGDYGSAIQIFATAAQSGKLDPTELQEAYYMAGYLLAIAGSDDYQTILGYMNMAIQANPNGSDVQRIQNIIDNITELIEEEMQSEQNAAGVR